MVDIWKVDNKFYLGTEEPTIEVSSDYFKGNRFWLNARNNDMYIWLQSQDSKKYPHYFTVPETQPNYVTVSDGRDWVFSNIAINEACVVVLPEITDRGMLSTVKLKNYGVCSCYLQFIKRIRNEGAPFYGDINIPF